MRQALRLQEVSRLTGSCRRIPSAKRPHVNNSRCRLSRIKAEGGQGDSSSTSSGSPSPSGGGQQAEEVDSFFGPAFAGLVQAALILTVASGVSTMQSYPISWSWDLPADGIQTILTFALLPMLAPLAVCLPSFSMGPMATDPKFLKQAYNQSGNISIILGSDETEYQAPSKELIALKREVTTSTFETAFSLIQAFLLTPWSKVDPSSSVLGSVVGRTAALASFECLLRGTFIFITREAILQEAAHAETGSWLFYVKLLGLGHENSSLYAATLLLVLLFVPVALIQPKAMQEFTRAAIIKPIRDSSLEIILKSKTDAERSERILSLQKQTGVNSLAVQALLSGAQIPRAERRGELELEGQNSSSSSLSLDPLPNQGVDVLESEKGSSSTSTSAGLIVTQKSASNTDAPPIKTLDRLGLLESETLAAIKSMRRANSATQVDQASMELLSAAVSSADVALRALTEADEASPTRVAAATEALVSLQDIKARLQVAEVKAKDEQVQQQQEEEDSAEFMALMRVESPEDKLVGQLVTAYSMVATVAVNGSFLASGSLAVSFGTAWLIRVLPLLFVDTIKRVKEASV